MRPFTRHSFFFSFYTGWPQWPPAKPLSGLFFSCHLRVNFFTVNCFWFSSCTCLLAHTPGYVKAKPRKKPFEICKEFCGAYLMRKKRSQSQMQNKSNGSNAMAQLNLVTKRGCFTRPTLMQTSVWEVNVCTFITLCRKMAGILWDWKCCSKQKFWG